MKLPMAMTRAARSVYCPNRAKAIPRWRIEWEIDKDDWHGEDFDGQMSLDFHDKDQFEEYLKTLKEAEAEGMCRNVQTFQREITIGDWYYTRHKELI